MAEKDSVAISPDLHKCLDVLKECLDRHISLCNTLLGYLIKHPSNFSLRTETKEIETNVVYALLGLVESIGSSCNTIVKLSDDVGLHCKDCFSISRSIIETSINACYLLAEGQKVAKEMIEHAGKKTLEDLNRESKIGVSEIGLYAVNKKGEKIFNGKNNTLLRRWTKHTVDKRIEIVGELLGDEVLKLLHWPRFMVYRHSSEILHGTLFGALYFTGQTMPVKEDNYQNFIDGIGQKHMMNLLAINMAVAAVVKSFDIKYGFKYLNDLSKNIMSDIKKIPMFNS